MLNLKIFAIFLVIDNVESQTRCNFLGDLDMLNLTSAARCRTWLSKRNNTNQLAVETVWFVATHVQRRKTTRVYSRALVYRGAPVLHLGFCRVYGRHGYRLKYRLTTISTIFILS